MTPKTVVMLGSFFLCLALGGCESSETTDSGVKGDGVLPDAVAPDMPAPDLKPTTKYIFIRIDDLTPNPSGPAAGADIDAVVLLDGGVTEKYTPPVASDCMNPIDQTECDNNRIRATGKPDAFPNYPDLKTCVATASVALGGGYIVLPVPVNVTIDNGDTVIIYEVGGCDINGTQADSEPVKVSVGPGDGTWTEILASGTGPKIEVKVSGLP